MTNARSPRRRKQGEAPKLALGRKRALLADIIASNKSAVRARVQRMAGGA